MALIGAGGTGKSWCFSASIGTGQGFRRKPSEKVLMKLRA
eukprot:gene56374-20952_t